MKTKGKEGHQNSFSMVIEHSRVNAFIEMACLLKCTKFSGFYCSTPAFSKSREKEPCEQLSKKSGGMQVNIHSAFSASLAHYFPTYPTTHICLNWLVWCNKLLLIASQVSEIQREGLFCS